MDFAELNDLQTPFFDSINKDIKEFQVSLNKADKIAAQEHPDTFFEDHSLNRVNATHNLVAQGFNRFVKKTQNNVNALVGAFRMKIQTLVMAVEDRDIQINGLTVELEQLKILMSQDNQKVKEALERHPQVQEALQSYTVNSPRVPLSPERETIIRLVLEIKKINNDLRMAISNNLSLKNKCSSFKKKYDDKVIIESEINQMRLAKDNLEQENKELRDKVAYLSSLIKEKGKNRIKDIEEEETEDYTLSGFLGDALGMNDLVEFLGKFFGGLKNWIKTAEIMAYVYLLFISIDFFVKSLAHYYFWPQKIYVICISPIIAFLMFRLYKATKHQ